VDIFWDVQDWVWGLSLIGLTIAIHATGVVMMGIAALKIRIWFDRSSFGLRHQVSTLIVLIGASGLLLATLHGMEAAIWAGAYLWVGAFDSPTDAMLYSVDSMTTRGASGLVLPRRWQIMGALEAADGMLLFGISTAFMFAVLQARWPAVTRALRSSSWRHHFSDQGKQDR
jgi:hypothetical protein